MLKFRYQYEQVPLFIYIYFLYIYIVFPLFFTPFVSLYLLSGKFGLKSQFGTNIFLLILLILLLFIDAQTHKLQHDA
jgi:prepilin signal peptidase PulO-like enzyme (type II secretory pathway)